MHQINIFYSNMIANLSLKHISSKYKWIEKFLSYYLIFLEPSATTFLFEA